MRLSLSLLSPAWSHPDSDSWHTPPCLCSTTEKPENLSAQVFITFTVTKTGAARLSAAPVFYSADKVKSDVELSDKTKETLARPLKAKAQKKKKAAPAEENK